ncbi:MAG: 50S ribosomal protein L29 [Pseudonocardiaceae bacterium]
MATTTAAADLRELTDEELVLRLREAKEELFNLRFQMATGQMDNNRRLRAVRRDIARIYTVMRERELGLSVSPDALSQQPTTQQPTKQREGVA